MAFDNSSIWPARLNKPHIVKVSGYWRVSRGPRKGDQRWIKAHGHAVRLNTHDAAFEPDRYRRIMDDLE